MLSKYSVPPNIMLDMYKYSIFFKVYFIFLNLNDIKHISILIIIFIRNSSNEFIFIKSVNTDMLPIKAPNNSLYISVFLFNIIVTDNSNKKSNPKLSSNIRSIYIFI